MSAKWRPPAAKAAGAGAPLPSRPRNPTALGARQPERFHRQVSLVVVGDMGCGKSTLSVRFSSGAFVPLKSTVCYDFHLRTVAARDGRQIQVRIWDTAGQEQHRALAPVLFRGVHACMLVYDCTSAQSFEHVPRWAETLLEMTRKPVPRVLVGNKTDAAGEERQVAIEEGAALARELGAVRFFETSAKDGSNVEAAFLALVDAVLDDGAEAEKDASVVKLGEEEEGKRKKCAC